MGLELVVSGAQGPEVRAVRLPAVVPGDGVVDLASGGPTLAAGEPAGAVAGGDELPQAGGDRVAGAAEVEEVPGDRVGDQAPDGGVDVGVGEQVAD